MSLVLGDLSDEGQELTQKFAGKRALPDCVLDCRVAFSLRSSDVFIFTFGEGDLKLCLNWEEQQILK